MEDKQTICPKCDHVQLCTDECVKCGVIISKFLEITSMPISERKIQVGKSNKKRWLKHPLTISFAAILAFLVLLIFLEVGASFFNVILPWHRQSAIETTLSWGGLADLPSTATNISITTSGSMFTRSFDLSFDAPADDISKWIEASRGLFGTIPQDRADYIHRYEISPGEHGAVGGWVEVLNNIGVVVIHISWS